MNSFQSHEDAECKVKIVYIISVCITSFGSFVVMRLIFLYMYKYVQYNAIHIHIRMCMSVTACSDYHSEHVLRRHSSRRRIVVHAPALSILQWTGQLTTLHCCHDFLTYLAFSLLLFYPTFFYVTNQLYSSNNEKGLVSLTYYTTATTDT